MNETFKRFLEDEFPPRLVYCMFDGEPRSIELDALADYSDYSVVGIDPAYKLPVMALTA